MSSVVFIGPCGGGKVPQNGASVKNYHILNFLKERVSNFKLFDTENWRTSPLILIRIVLYILFHPKSSYIVSANTYSAYRLFRIFAIFPRKRNIIYWVIGGRFPSLLINKDLSISPYKKIRLIIVEGDRMKHDLNGLGFENVITVPNFKHISHIPTLENKDDNQTKFVFLSRITPPKGCDYIIEATRMLNESGLKNFSVDFYGPIDESYNINFISEVDKLPNTSYKGFLDLRNADNYNKLAEYDCLLFPTYWSGEGFPGVIVDAHIAGLSVIASDWSLNKDLISNGTTGIIIPVHNINALAEAMKKITLDHSLRKRMSSNSHNQAQKYDINNVLNDDLLQKLKI